MTYYIFRGDPDTSPPPGANPALTVPLAADDKSIVCIGSKMFGSSDLSFISRGNQERIVGKRSHGRLGDVPRSEPSHGDTLHVPFDGTELHDETFEGLDQYMQDAVADLVFRRYLIVTQNPDRSVSGAWIDAATIRAL